MGGPLHFTHFTLTSTIYWQLFSTPVRWGLLDFMSAASPASFSSSQTLTRTTSHKRSIAVVPARPEQQAQDQGVPRRTSTASSWSQWPPTRKQAQDARSWSQLSPDPNSKPRIRVGDLNSKLVIAVVPAGPEQQARIRAFHAGPRLQARDCRGPRWTRTARAGSKWSPPDIDHKESPKIYQIEHQKEFQKICKIHMPVSEDMPDRMPGGRGGEDNSEI